MWIPKNTSHNFPSRLLCFWALCCTFTRFKPLFFPLTWFQRIVVDPGFIHRHKSTQKHFRIAVKICQIFLRSGHTNVFLVSIVSNHDTHLHRAFSCTIVYAKYWAHAQLRWIRSLYLRVIQNIIMDFINHFWCSDLTWTTWTWYSFSARTTTTKFGELLLIHNIRRSWLGLGFW